MFILNEWMFRFLAMIAIACEFLVFSKDMSLKASWVKVTLFLDYQSKQMFKRLKDIKLFHFLKKTKYLHLTAQRSMS